MGTSVTEPAPAPRKGTSDPDFDNAKNLKTEKIGKQSPPTVKEVGPGTEGTAGGKLGGDASGGSGS